MNFFVNYEKFEIFRVLRDFRALDCIFTPLLPVLRSRGLPFAFLSPTLLLQLKGRREILRMKLTRKLSKLSGID